MNQKARDGQPPTSHMSVPVERNGCLKGCVERYWKSGKASSEQRGAVYQLVKPLLGKGDRLGVRATCLTSLTQTGPFDSAYPGKG